MPPVSRDSLAHARSLAVTPLLCPSSPATEQHPPPGPENRPPPMLELLPRSSMTNPDAMPIPNHQRLRTNRANATLSTGDPAAYQLHWRQLFEEYQPAS